MIFTEYFVISNPVEVFGAPATQKKAKGRDPIQAKAVTAKKVYKFQFKSFFLHYSRHTSRRLTL